MAETLLNELAGSLVLLEAEREAIASENDALRSEVAARRLIGEQAVGYLRDSGSALEALAGDLQAELDTLLAGLAAARVRPDRTTSDYLATCEVLVREAQGRLLSRIEQQQAAVSASVATLASAQAHRAPTSVRRPGTVAS